MWSLEEEEEAAEWRGGSSGPLTAGGTAQGRGSGSERGSLEGGGSLKGERGGGSISLVDCTTSLRSR
jgi:hypothetical protein